MWRSTGKRCLTSKFIGIYFVLDVNNCYVANSAQKELSDSVSLHIYGPKGLKK